MINNFLTTNFIHNMVLLTVMLLAISCQSIKPNHKIRANTKTKMIRVIEVNIGRKDNIEISAIKIAKNKILVSDFGVEIGWFAPGEWVVGDSHSGGGGIRLKSIDTKNGIVLFEDSSLALP